MEKSLEEIVSDLEEQASKSKDSEDYYGGPFIIIKAK